MIERPVARTAPPPTSQITTGAQTDEISSRHIAPDPAMVGRVFSARVTHHEPVPTTSVLEQPSGWVDLPDRQRRARRAAVALRPWKSLSKGQGGGRIVSLKLRF